MEHVHNESQLLAHVLDFVHIPQSSFQTPKKQVMNNYLRGSNEFTVQNKVFDAKMTIPQNTITDISNGPTTSFL